MSVELYDLWKIILMNLSRWGGGHEKYAVAAWNLKTTSVFAQRQWESDDRPEDFPDADWLTASEQCDEQENMETS
jgi:hypothetical protein